MLSKAFFDEDKNVIHVDRDKFIKKIMQDSVDVFLKDARDIG